MSDALSSIYYILNKFLSSVFSMYLFDGVSVGMILVVSFILIVLLKYLVAIPKVNIQIGKGGKSEKDSSND